MLSFDQVHGVVVDVSSAAYLSQSADQLLMELIDAVL